VTAISGMPTSEICSYRDSLGYLAQGAPRRVTQVSVKWTHNLPIERRTLYHWAIAAPAKYSSPMPRCQDVQLLWCAVGA